MTSLYPGLVLLRVQSLAQSSESCSEFRVLLRAIDEGLNARNVSLLTLYDG